MSHQQLAPTLLMEKANTACTSGRMLLGVGDVDGAANRAYYAMFTAARAALLASGAPVVESEVGRTHSGLIGAFGKYLVKDGPVSKDIGRLLNRAHEIRLIADYKGDSVEYADARDMVAQAATFVSTMEAMFLPEMDLPADNMPQP